MKLRMKSRCFGHGMRAGPVSSVFQLSFLLLPALVILAVAGEEAIEGTLLFLHVWKCGGTSLRKLLCDWAREEGLPCATVATCSKLSLDERKICLNRHSVIFPEEQEPFIAKQRVLAGHFRWGFQSYAAEPHTLVTTLRNPLELFVSGEQYLHRKATSTLPKATYFVSNAMRKSLGRYPAGFLHRFVGHSVDTRDELHAATLKAAYNLKTFSLVGVIEQYEGFIAVLKTLVDPSGRHDRLWNDHLNQKLNASPVKSTEVLANIDPGLLEKFNVSLSYQWLVYGYAVRLYEERCLEVLPQYLQSTLCYVPNPPAAYS